jgi:tetratricopeptide (TPR) repeat protein
MSKWEGEPIEDKELNEKQLWEILPHRDGQGRAEVLLALSKQAGFRGSFEEALALAETAQEIYKSLGATVADEDIANAFTGISYSLKQLNKTEEAVRVLDKAVAIYREDHFPFVDDLLRTQAIWYSEMGQWEKTLDCHLEATRVNEIDGNQEWLAKSQYNVGVAYGHLGNFPEAVKQYKLAREIFKSLRMVAEVSRCDEALAEAYVELGGWELALEAGNRALDVARTAGWLVRLSWIYFHLGKAKVLAEDFDQAEVDLSDALILANRADETDWNLIVSIESETANLLRLKNRFQEADAIDARIATIREILG